MEKSISTNFLRENPCLSCGACCAHFRVSFYWKEAEPSEGGTVPQTLTEDISTFRSCMRGTNQPKPYCVALQGKIGKDVRCSIYLLRPSTCREFGIRWIHQKIVATPKERTRCNKARADWNLPPLKFPKIQPNHQKHQHQTQFAHLWKTSRREHRTEPPAQRIPVRRSTLHGYRRNHL